MMHPSSETRPSRAALRPGAAANHGPFACAFALLFLLLSACSEPRDLPEPSSGAVHAFTVADIGPETPPAVQLAVQACAGLYNRRRGGSVYTRMNDKDSRWLDALGLKPAEVVRAADFLETCVTEFPACVRYAYAAQQELLPSILTVGAVLGAVPLDEGAAGMCGNVVFDAVAEFEERDTPYLAAKHVYETYGGDTTGLAMLNPGYDADDPRVWDPAISKDMDPSMVDFVFSEKLFVIFLVNGCIEGTEQNALLNEMAEANPWPDPIGVYGYANSWKVFGGYVFEAQTLCAASRNMGAIPTTVNNLSFFSTRRPPIRDPGEIERNAPEDIPYDPGATYVAFVVGDGDNVAYILDTRSQWFRERLSHCRRTENACVPLTWTMSPHLRRIAPDVLEWYHDMSRRTGKDTFMLPPSGHLYAYPASMSEEAQDRFVALTEQDARLLGTRSTMDWEWWSTWRRAETEFLPKYARGGGAIGGVFPVNVPYMIPTFTWPDPGQFYKVLPGGEGGQVVLFRPREWRGIDESGGTLTREFYLSPEHMAEELGGYPRGTVSYVYMTSDGGLDLSNAFVPMVKLLPPHVRLVSADAAVRLALQAASSGARPE